MPPPVSAFSAHSRTGSASVVSTAASSKVIQADDACPFNEAELLHEFNSSLLDEMASLLHDGKAGGADNFYAYRPNQSTDETFKHLPVARTRTHAAISEKDIEKTERLELAASAGIKSYKAHKPDFAEILQRLLLKDLSEITHEEAKELLQAAGVDHIASAHWGSGIDAVLGTAFKRLARLPGGVALGSNTRELVAETLRAPFASGFDNRGIMRVATDPLRNITSGAASDATKHIDGLFFGRSITPCANEMFISAVQMRDLTNQLTEVKKQYERNNRKDLPSTLTKAELEKIGVELSQKLFDFAEDEKEKSQVFGISARQNAMTAVTIANVCVQLITRVGGGIGLNAVSLGALIPAIALITYPTMAAVAKGVSNWHDTKEIARVGLYKYKEALTTGKSSEAEMLEMASHFMQDHFQHSSEANYHRTLNNVLHTRIGEQIRTIKKQDYDIGEIDLLLKSGSEEEYEATRKLFEVKRKLNLIDSQVKSEYLDEDLLTVERLIGYVQDPDRSPSDLMDDVQSQADALLAVHLSPDPRAVALFIRFKEVFNAQRRFPVSDEMLLHWYAQAPGAYEPLEPINGAAIFKQRPSDIHEKGFIRSRLKLPFQKGRELSHRSNEIDLLTQKIQVQKELEKREAGLASLRAKKNVTSSPSAKLFFKLEEDRKKLANLKAGIDVAIFELRDLQKDTLHFERHEGRQISLDGLAARLILSGDKNIGHGVAQYFRNDVKSSIKKRFNKRFGLSFGLSAAVEGGYSAGRAVKGMEPPLSALPKGLRPRPDRPKRSGDSSASSETAVAFWMDCFEHLPESARVLGLKQILLTARELSFDEHRDLMGEVVKLFPLIPVSQQVEAFDELRMQLEAYDWVDYLIEVPFGTPNSERYVHPQKSYLRKGSLREAVEKLKADIWARVSPEDGKDLDTSYAKLQALSVFNEGTATVIKLNLPKLKRSAERLVLCSERAIVHKSLQRKPDGMTPGSVGTEVVEVVPAVQVGHLTAKTGAVGKYLRRITFGGGVVGGWINNLRSRMNYKWPDKFRGPKEFKVEGAKFKYVRDKTTEIPPGFNDPAYNPGRGIPDFLFRGDKNSPDQILKNGMHSKGVNPDRRDHLSDVKGDSGFISTSKKTDIAAEFALKAPGAKTGFFYKITPPPEGHINYSKMIDFSNAYTRREAEIAFIGHIETYRIPKAYRVRNWSPFGGPRIVLESYTLVPV